MPKYKIFEAVVLKSLFYFQESFALFKSNLFSYLGEKVVCYVFIFSHWKSYVVLYNMYKKRCEKRKKLKEIDGRCGILKVAAFLKVRWKGKATK